MHNIRSFINQVEIIGSVYSGSIADLYDLDCIINNLDKYCEDKEYAVICGEYTVDMIQGVLNQNEDEGVPCKLEAPTFSRLICEGSFSRGGLTFHLIVKPDMGRESLWVSTDKNANPKNSLIVKP